MPKQSKSQSKSKSANQKSTDAVETKLSVVGIKRAAPANNPLPESELPVEPAPEITPPEAETSATEPIAPAPEVTPSAPQPPTYLKPKPAKPKAEPKQPAIDEVTNSEGVVFRVGDAIHASSYLNPNTAEITDFYQDSDGCHWAYYKPTLTEREPEWQQGVSRASSLQKLPSA